MGARSIGPLSARHRPWDHGVRVDRSPLDRAWRHAAFAVLVLADAAMVCRPEIPRRLDILAAALAPAGAYRFTVRATSQASRD